jgi:hypothetical protein
LLMPISPTLSRSPYDRYTTAQAEPDAEYNLQTVFRFSETTDAD